MLKILDYEPSTSDERKFLNSNYKQKLEKEMRGEFEQDNYYSTPDLNASSILGIAGGGPSLYDQHFMSDMHDKTLSMGQNSVPRLQNSVVLLKNELQSMVRDLKPFLEKQPSESGLDQDQYEEYIKKLNPDYYKVQDNHF